MLAVILIAAVVLALGLGLRARRARAAAAAPASLDSSPLLPIRRSDPSGRPESGWLR